MPKRVLTEQQKQQHTVYMRTWRKQNHEKINRYQSSLKVKLARHERHVKRTLSIKNGDIVVSEAQRQRQRKAERSWQERNQKKHSAEHIASKIPIGYECEFCGDTERLVRHHPDYDYPTIIVTCCQTCHRNIHVNGLKSFTGESENESLIVSPITAGNTVSFADCARSPYRRALVMQPQSSLTLIPQYNVAAELEQTRIGYVQEGLTDSTPKFCPTLPFTSGVRKPSRLFYGGIMN